MTVKSVALVAVPAAVLTWILPVVAPAGTLARILVALSLADGGSHPIERDPGPGERGPFNGHDGSHPA